MNLIHAGITASLVITLSLVVGVAHPAWGFDSVNHNGEFRVPLKEFDLFSYQSAEELHAQQRVGETLSNLYGGRWQTVAWNPQTNTPHCILGTGAAVAPGFRTSAEVEDAAWRVLTESASVLGIDVETLRLLDVTNGLGKTAAHFQQVYHELDVWGGRVHATFTESGRLFVLGSDFYPAIAVDPHPSIPSEGAVNIACGDLPFDTATDSIVGSPALLVLPLPLSETEVAYHLVWRVSVRTRNPFGLWVTHIDAHDGQVLWRYNDVQVTYLGDTESDVEPNSYCHSHEDQSMPYLDIAVQGLGTVTSDSEGNWSIGGTGGDRVVSCNLYGPYADLHNNGGDDAFFSGTAEEDVPLTVDFENANSQQDERDVFDAVNDLHDFFQLFAPGFAYPHQRTDAYVSRDDLYCPGNAWWDPGDGSINFCEADDGYANTGEIQSIVYHEFGHGVQDAILGGQGSQGLGEGNADILANLVTQESIIGLGYFQDNCTIGFRDSDNDLRYPDDVIGQEEHLAGRVIAGFNWDAMGLLQGIYGTDTGTNMSAARWHSGRVLELPTTQPDQVMATFIADDDDGNALNGTPHYEHFCRAAWNHGFPAPGETYVDFNYSGPEDGTPWNPYDTLAEGIEAVIEGCRLVIKPGTSTETATVTKAMTIVAYDGVVVIGG
ncbi:hypothetical protein ACFL6M_05665 [Candidatus Eisenbacteria bacterium]|uniref:FTP domain-containing protein n=1 Tax=Eiseniibacteriota bacterium TaxID=2212470 RepID=A0ABV6YLM8_UNCEI